MPGQELIGTGYLSHAGLLQMGSIGYVAFLPSGWIGRCTLGLALTHGFLFSELPEKPANLSHLKTRWARFAFHWYDYLAAVFFPSLGTTDVMLQVDVFINFTQWPFQNSEKAISAPNDEQTQIRKVVLQNRLALDILTAAQGGTCAIFATQCSSYIPDMTTNVTHFTKHMNKMIPAMDTPEASTTSLWRKLTSSL